MSMNIIRDSETGEYNVQAGGMLIAQAVPQDADYIVALDPPAGFLSSNLAKVERWGKMWRVAQLGSRLGAEKLSEGLEEAICNAVLSLQRDLANDRG